MSITLMLKDQPEKKIVPLRREDKTKKVHYQKLNFQQLTKLKHMVNKKGQQPTHYVSGILCHIVLCDEIRYKEF